LREEPGHLATLADASGGVPVAMIVDQFEEVFTLCTDDAARQVFIAGLLGLIRSPALRHTVVLTMRTDFESFVVRVPDFQPLFEAGKVLVTPLNAAELREAIEAPAVRVGLKFETGLVDALLQDTLGEPAALPLLQFTLLKLWENRERNRITWEAYKRLGGGRSALARSADSFYNGLLPEEQLTTRRIFTRLVRPGQGLEFTSNRVQREALFQTGEARDRVERVLNKLIAVRLVRLSEGDVAADAQVEVAHEALVRNWPRLVDWLEEERDIIRRRQRLTDAAEHWEALSKDPGALLSVTLLDESFRTVETSGVQLNELEAEFVQASQEAIKAAQETELDRKAKLVAAKRMAEYQALEAEHFREMAVGLRWERYIIPAAIYLILIGGAILAYLLSNRNAIALLAYVLGVSVGAYLIVQRLECKAERDCALVIETGSGHKVRWGPTTYYCWPFVEHVRARVPLYPLQYTAPAQSIQLGAEDKLDFRVIVYYRVDTSHREMYQDEINVLSSVYRVQRESPSTADHSEAKPDSRSYTVDDLRRIWEKRLLKDIIATMIEVLPGRSRDELTGQDIQARTKIIDEARLRLAARVHQWGMAIEDMGILDVATNKE
jgi:regulator of protease activity HflC (stomatin/prohibitin superfamily)